VTSPEHPSAADRAAAGKQARRVAPRSENASWEPAADRPDPVAILEEQGVSRVQELLPIRYGRMLQSPLSFYRGTAALMAMDLAGTANAGLQVQLCGDAHLSNFGLFASPERDLVFDCNDFDETHPGPFEWDVKRLAASGLVTARSNGHDEHDQRETARTVGRVYRDAMRRFAGMGNLDVWYAKLDEASIADQLRTAGADAQRLKGFQRDVTRARRKDSLRAFTKLTTVVDGHIEIVSDPPLIVPLTELAGATHEAEIAALSAMLTRYRESLQNDRRVLFDSYEYIQIARKVVGVGSVGTRAWIILLTGRDHQDPLFLQAKEAQASVLEQFTTPSVYANHGERVVRGQRLMQATSDILLGWLPATGLDGESRHFYVRQLWDGKGSAEVEGMTPANLISYVALCAWTLARAHARSGDRVAIGAYLGAGEVFEEAVGEFSWVYADQNDRDYAALQAAAASGRIVAGPPLR
jgi:uncharacterized protein (DUF2252 family)